MDIDCDGGAKTGPCANDPSHYWQTAFEYKGKPVDAQAVVSDAIGPLCPPLTACSRSWSSTIRRRSGRRSCSSRRLVLSSLGSGLNGFEVVGVLCGGQLTWAVFVRRAPSEEHC